MVVANRVKTVPRNGTPNQNVARTRQNDASIQPSSRYGASLPTITSLGVTGVETSSSMVPRSHSREMVSEVSCAPTSAMMTATTPGMMKLRLSRSSLNQTRDCTLMGWICCSGVPWRSSASSATSPE